MSQEEQKINNIPTLIERLVRERAIVNTKPGNYNYDKGIGGKQCCKNAHWDPKLSWKGFSEEVTLELLRREEKLSRWRESSDKDPVIKV